MFNFCFGQVHQNHKSSYPSQIAINFGIERNDFSASFDYVHSFQNRFSINPSLGMGIIHSFVQSNPFIQCGFNTYYNWIFKNMKDGPFIFLGVGGGYGYSFYRKPVQTNFNEIRLGYLLSVGNRFRFFQKGGLGLLTESFNGISQKVFLSYPNFHFSIGFSYVF